MTRRAFSGLAAGGIAVSALASPAGAMVRGTDGGAAGAALDLVVFDERFSDAVLFADTARAGGAAVRPSGGDLGVLWFGGLRDELGTSIRRIAGMGRHSDFWIMRQLAAEKGMTLRFHAEHDFRGRRVLTHRLPEGAGGLAGLVAVDGMPWAACIARHVLAGAEETSGRLSAVPSATPASADHPGLLVSWVFA